MRASTSCRSSRSIASIFRGSSSRRRPSATIPTAPPSHRSSATPARSRRLNSRATRIAATRPGRPWGRAASRSSTRASCAGTKGRASWRWTRGDVWCARRARVPTFPRSAPRCSARTSTSTSSGSSSRSSAIHCRVARWRSIPPRVPCSPSTPRRRTTPTGSPAASPPITGGRSTPIPAVPSTTRCFRGATNRAPPGSSRRPRWPSNARWPGSTTGCRRHAPAATSSATATSAAGRRRDTAR